MRLIAGVGNCEIFLWTFGSIASCFLVAFPLSALFQLYDVNWRVVKGGKYEDFEKFIEAQNMKLKAEFHVMHGDSNAIVGSLPYYSPEVYCPHLVSVGGRKLCAPWLFKGAIKLNQIDEEKWKEEKERVFIMRGELAGIEGSTGKCRAMSIVHTTKENEEERRTWREVLSECRHEEQDGTVLTPERFDVMYVNTGLGWIESSAVKSANVCQLVLDVATNLTGIVKKLREFGEKGYRIMNYEKIESDTARFSFIQSNCTDHFGAKFIKKYLV